jgi:hypothetical protein
MKDYRPPTSMTYEEYLEWNSHEEETAYFKQLAGVASGDRSKNGHLDPVAQLIFLMILSIGCLAEQKLTSGPREMLISLSDSITTGRTIQSYRFINSAEVRNLILIWASRWMSMDRSVKN